jgi:hypothetical protein
MDRAMSFRGPESASTKEPICVVCGQSDKRALCTTRLSTGETVVVCGTHELMHRRARTVAASVRDLAALVRDRRNKHRRVEQIDELGARLASAFRPERRKTDRRR